jgi:ubiquinone/menaquinone biosynthesis C-methylase UbiE
MSTPRKPEKRDHSGTYFVVDPQGDRLTKEEVVRLAKQDRLVTASMGGVLAEQPPPSAFGEVLDVACGAGGWAIEAAQTYPSLVLVGIDLNPRMVKYAQAQAVAHQVEERVSFRIMDALHPLHFPDASFDLVNLRFASSFVRTWEWPALIRELLRVVRPGGVIRLTDQEVIHLSSSPAAMQFCEMLLCALSRSGHLFAQESCGVTASLAPLLRQHGCQQVQTHPHALQYRAGTASGQAYVENGVHVMRTLRPFLQKWGCLGKDFDTIHRQALKEMQLPDFSAIWNLLTVWGIKPS